MLVVRPRELTSVQGLTAPSNCCHKLPALAGSEPHSSLRGIASASFFEYALRVAVRFAIDVHTGALLWRAY